MSDCGVPDGTGIGPPIGRTGGVEGDDPKRELVYATGECAFGGTVPTGTNATDLEDWAA